MRFWKWLGLARLSFSYSLYCTQCATCINTAKGEGIAREFSLVYQNYYVCTQPPVFAMSCHVTVKLHYT